MVCEGAYLQQLRQPGPLKGCPHELMCTNCNRKGHAHRVCKSPGVGTAAVRHAFAALFLLVVSRASS